MNDGKQERGVAFVRNHVGDDVVSEGSFAGQSFITIATHRIHDTVQALRDEGGFTFLDDLTAVDYLDRPEVSGRFHLVYHLVDLESNEVLRLKTILEDEDGEVASLSDLFGIANWLEREVFDMFGLRFAGHPDLRRILMSEDFEDFPLRRDFPWHGRVPLTDPMREPDFARGVAGEHPY